MLHTQTVADSTLELLRTLLAMPELEPFALVGGTNLALRLGHRVSVDIDLFTNEPFDVEAVRQALRETFPSALELSVRNQTMLYQINGVKTDMIKHQYPYIQPFDELDGLRMMSVPDVVAMKLGAVAGRGAKKDFWDIFALLDQFTLPEMITFYTLKYPNSDAGQVIRSLVYFEDAEEQQDPVSLNDVSWHVIKETLRSQIKNYTNNLVD